MVRGPTSTVKLETTHFALVLFVGVLSFAKMGLTVYVWNIVLISLVQSKSNQSFPEISRYWWQGVFTMSADTLTESGMWWCQWVFDCVSYFVFRDTFLLGIWICFSIGQQLCLPLFVHMLQHRQRRRWEIRRNWLCCHVAVGPGAVHFVYAYLPSRVHIRPSKLDVPEVARSVQSAWTQAFGKLLGHKLHMVQTNAKPLSSKRQKWRLHATTLRNGFLPRLPWSSHGICFRSNKKHIKQDYIIYIHMILTPLFLRVSVYFRSASIS